MQTPYYFLLLATCPSYLLLVVFHVDQGGNLNCT